MDGVEVCAYPHGPSRALQEYVEYYGGAGVQHIALNTTDIIRAVSERLSGVNPPHTLYIYARIGVCCNRF